MGELVSGYDGVLSKTHITRRPRLALNLSQIVGRTMGDEGEELSVGAIQNLCFRLIDPCRKDVDSCLPPSIGGRSLTVLGGWQLGPN